MPVGRCSFEGCRRPPASCRRCPPSHSQGKYPDLDSNQDLELRRLGHRRVAVVAVSYKDTALAAELRAGNEARRIWPSGAEGSRTLTFPLKRRKRCRYATTPKWEWAYAFEPRRELHCLVSLCSSPGWSRTGHRRRAPCAAWSAVVRRHIRSLCFRYTTGQSGRSESNRLSRAPKARGAPFPFIPL
jgi:hypothetical protein